ncbi:MAG: response regulator [Bacteroidota bacterium]
MTIKTAIVDDEPHARRYIADLLRQDDDIHLIGELRNGREALAFIAEEKPELIFLDIHMPGISGLDVVKKLPEHEQPIIIFTTAYDQYAIKAFEAEALDYLLKPFDETRLFDALDRAKSFINLKEQAKFNQKLLNLYQDFVQSKTPHLTRFVIKDKGLEKVIKLNEVLWLEASSVYVIIHSTKGQQLYRVTMNLLEEQLPPDMFIRIHRSIIVNYECVDKVVYQNNNTFSFRMNNGKSLISSRSYKAVISAFLSEHV